MLKAGSVQTKVSDEAKRQQVRCKGGSTSRKLGSKDAHAEEDSPFDGPEQLGLVSLLDLVGSQASPVHQAASERLQLNLHVMSGDALQQAEEFVAESKVILAVMHTCNTLYVRASAVKDGKAKAALVRELNRKVQAAGASLPKALVESVSTL